MRAVIGAVHDVLVGPFEIEGVDQRLAQAAVLELRAPHVDEPALRAGRRIVGQHGALDAAVLEGGKIVARRPGARGELLAEQIILGGEAFEADLAVAVIFETQRVEIVLPARHRQIGAPPILDALEFDEMAGLEAADLVGAAAERNFQRRLVERLLGIIGREKIGRPATNSGTSRPRLSAKRTTTVRSSVASAPLKSRKQLGDDRMALFLQRGQREGHVMRGERRAVVEFRLGAQREAVGQPVVGDANAARGQPVHGVGLVARAHHQRREGQLHALRGVALQDEAVERIEGLERLIELPVRADLREHAALGRVRIDVVEIRKIRRIGEVAEADMPWRSASCAPRRRHEFRRGRCAPRRQRKGMRDGVIKTRCGTLAALSASHHQMVGKRRQPVFRQRGRAAEAVPARRAHLAVGPLRHDVEIPQQHAVERLGGGDQARRGPWQR